MRRLGFGFVLVLFLAGCGGSGQPGYLSQGSTSATFIQWRQSTDGSLTGSVTMANLNGTRVTNRRLPFTGVLDGDQVTLTFPKGVGDLSNITGSLSGGTLAFTWSRSDGTIVTVAFSSATVDDYNNAVQTLRDRVLPSPWPASICCQPAPLYSP